MKVSYKVLKKYIPHIGSPEEIAQDLIMHTAEVEGIEKVGQHLEHVFIGKIISAEKHPDADKLNVCQVDVCGETRQIICGAPNVKAGLVVCVALPGAELKPGFIIEKSKIRGIVSNGMLCSEDELGLVEDRQDGIMELPDDAPLNTCACDYFGFDDVILEIDNKAINHRPDLFSHIGIAREIEAINGNKLPYDMNQQDFSHLPDLGIQNDIPSVVRRYMGLKVSSVSNIPSPDYVKDVLLSHDIESKGLLVDITNYSLYLYGQPTHCFDADTLTGNIHIRYAKDGESFKALNGKEYILTKADIVIADDVSVLALGGVIGGADSAVSMTTKNIVIESAWFDHATIRQTGKRHGIRTDSLNVFEKDLVCSIRHTGPSLIIKELMEHCSEMKLEAFTDLYPEPLSQTTIPYSLERINSLIGASYSDEQVGNILRTIGVEKKASGLLVPLWRKDLSHIADIAEEVARLDGFEKIKKTIPRVTLGAVTQSPAYRAKRVTRNFLTSKGFFEMYTYSFTNAALQQKALCDIDSCPEMKNYLSEELTHLRSDLIVKLLEACEDNARDYPEMKLFEIEKVFNKTPNGVTERYELSGIIYKKSENLYYDTQDLLSDIFKTLGVQKYGYQTTQNAPNYAHNGRSAAIIVRGKETGYIGEISPKVRSNFSLGNRASFFKIDMDALLPAAFSLISAEEISQYQENNFDITFVVDLETPGRNIVSAIEKTSPLITKVSLFDIYENAEKLPGQRALSFTIHYGSLTQTLDDDVKNKLIKDIVTKVEKVGGKLR